MGLMGMGREKLWNPEIWANIDKGVMEEVASVRIAQKIFPTVIMSGAQTVVDEQINIGAQVPLQMEEGLTKSFVELFAEFVLTPNQAAMEPAMGTAQKLARLAAKALAQAEDRVLFQGQRAIETLAELAVQVLSSKVVSKGMLFEKDDPAVNVDTTLTDATKPYPESIFRGVTEGIARLHKRAQNEPIGLILETSIFGDAHAPTEASLVMPADRIVPLVTGGSETRCSSSASFHESEGLFFEGPVPGASRKSDDVVQRDGLLAALAGQPTTIYVSQDAMTIPTQTDPQGNLHFRVVERIQYVCRDPRSLLRIEFRP